MFLDGECLGCWLEGKVGWSFGDGTASGTGNEESFMVVEDDFPDCIGE